MPHENDQFDTLPTEIIDALRELDGPAVLPDLQRDADVLSGARQHLAASAQVERKRRSLRLFFAGGAGGAIAAAAMVAFVVLIWSPAHNEAPLADMAAMSTQEAEAHIALAGDLDQDGRIDILDAYALAKQIKHVKSDLALSTHDLNGDGEIDQRDIDWIANQAVALNPGERS